MTGKKLQRLCDVWRERLRLKDWKIVCKFGTLEEVKGDYAYTSWDITRKEAFVLIGRPSEYEEDLDDADTEESLIHELLHLVFPALGVTPTNEFGLNTISSLLYRGMHRTKRRERDIVKTLSIIP